MGTSTDLQQYLASRASLYRWLSRLYDGEIDADYLRKLKSLRFPADCGDETLQDGYRALQACLAETGNNGLDTLAADYARCFLGAGIAKGSEAAAFPYASVYTDSRRIMMQAARDHAVEAYASRGLAVDARKSGIPEDHLARLLEFMAWLCQSALTAAADSSAAGIESLLAEQRDFLDSHLLNWVPAFCRDLDQNAHTSFYKSIGKITGSWLQLDRRSLTSLIA